MSFDPHFFTQPVPKNGFVWFDAAETALNEAGRYLTADVPSSPPAPWRSYNPLKETGLFRNFADVKPTERGILEFANRYGKLGAASVEIPVAEGDKPGSKLMGTGEQLSGWRYEILHLRAVCDLWEAIQANNATTPLAPHRAHDRLKDAITWVKDKGVKFAHPTLGSWWIAGQDEPERISRFPHGDLVAPARSAIQRLINEKLRKLGVTARLLSTDLSYSKLVLRLVPQNLLGCIWLQFASAVDGDRTYSQCQDCRLWFEATRHAARADKVYCSATCRVSAHRKKIEEARRMSREGKTAKEIAGILGTKIQTVKGWVK